MRILCSTPPIEGVFGPFIPLGRALVEAMACGVPVVGSTSGEISAVIGDAGLLTPEADAVCLRDALARVLADPGLRQELGRRGRERVLAHFTHQRIAEHTVAVYRDAVARSSGIASATTGARGSWPST